MIDHPPYEDGEYYCLFTVEKGTLEVRRLWTGNVSIVDVRDEVLEASDE